jgi:hypothetical protein
MMGNSLRASIKSIISSVAVNAAAIARIRLGLTLSITLLVISSPIIVLINPAQVSAAAVDNTKRVDSSNYHSTPHMSETPLSFHSSSSILTTTAPST